MCIRDSPLNVAPQPFAHRLGRDPDANVHRAIIAQVAETAARWFSHESDLVLVACDADRLGPALKWEPSRGGALFPHLYRPLDLPEVVWDKSLPLGATGHIFPEGLW